MPFKFVEVPEDFECPITHEIMVDPVFTAEGDTYEREVITKWLMEHDTNPNTNETLEHKNLTSNKTLKSQIAEFVIKNQKSFEKEFIEAAKQNDGDTINLILKLNANLRTGFNFNAVDSNGWSALHFTVFNKNEGLIDILLKKKVEINLNSANMHAVEPILLPDQQIEVERSELENSELNKRIESNNLSLQNYIAQQYIQINNPYTTNKNEYYKYIDSARNSYRKDNEQSEQIIKQTALNIEKIKNQQRANNMTPLVTAAYFGHDSIIEFLISNGANIEAETVNKETALHWAVNNNNLNTVICLLNMRANIEAKNNEGNTALHIASQNGYEDMIHLLMEAGADYKAKNKQEKTPIEVAYKNNQLKITNLIRQKAKDLKNVLRKQVQQQEIRIKQLEATVQQLTIFLQQLSPEFPLGTQQSNRNTIPSLTNFKNITFIGQLSRQANSSITQPSTPTEDKSFVKSFKN